MFNKRIAYLMFRRLGISFLVIVAVIVTICAFLAFIFACLELSNFLSGIRAYGLIPVALLIVIGMSYPFAVSDYNDELRTQESVEKRLKRSNPLDYDE